MQIIIDGMLTHYERSGTGPVILVLPGWADTSASWRGIQKRLSTQYDVIVLDLPGFGGSQAPSGAWNIIDYADFVKKFVQKLGLASIRTVIGHSNGGAIAIKGLATGQFATNTLILLASAGIRPVRPGRKHSLRLLTKAAKVISTPLPNSVKLKLKRKLYASVGSDMLVAEHMKESFKLIVADDVQSDAAHLQVPTLLIYGTADRDTPIEFGETYRSLISGSRLESITGAGHFLHTENADEVMPLIQEFIA